MSAGILLVGCPPELADRLRAAGDTPVEEFPDPQAVVDLVIREPAAVAAVVLGGTPGSPLETIQRLGTADGQLAVVVLADGARVAETLRELQFAPFVGEDVSCRADTYPDAVVSAAVAAADRTLRRRAHRARMRAAAAQLGQGLQYSGSAATVQSLGTLLDHAPVGVVTLDDESRVVSLNRYAERLLDAERRTLGRRPLIEVFPESERVRLSVMLIPTTPLFPSPTRRFQRVRSDGRAQELDVTAARFQAAAGLRGTILLLQDVTEAAGTERARRRQAAMLQEDVIETLSAAQEAAAGGDAERAERLIAHARERSEALAVQLLEAPPTAAWR